MLDEILLARAHALAARAAAALLAIGRDRRALQVAGVADRHRNLLVGDQVFQADLGGFVLNDGAALVAVLLLDLFQFLDDDAAQLLLAAENGFVLGDAAANFRQLFQDFVDRQARQAVQLQFEDGVGLHRVERTRQRRGHHALQRSRLSCVPCLPRR